MARDATAASIAAGQAEVARPVLLVELDFPSGFLRVNSSDRSIFFESQGASPLNEFFGVAQLGTVSTIGETSGLQATGVELTLSGIPPENIALAFEQAQGRSGKIWLGFLDDSYALTIDPILVFAGLIDNSNIDIGDTASVSLTVENRLIAWERPKIRRYTNEDQQQRFSGDKFLEFVNQTMDKELLWGIVGDGVPRVEKVAAPAAPSGAGQEGARQVSFRGETFTLPGQPGGGGGGGGGAGGGAGSCFPAGTLVLMADGSRKAIDTIRVGDSTAGGRVIGAMVFETTDLFVYEGVIVSGGHAVHHRGAWTRVEDADTARPLDAARSAAIDRLYVLKTSQQRIYIDGVTFADYVEAAPGSAVYAKYNAVLLTELQAQDEGRNEARGVSRAVP